jgi:hypothetical protein
MTIKRAREIFGDDIKNLSDDQVSEMIARDTRLISGLLDMFDNLLTMKAKGVNNGIRHD